MEFLISIDQLGTFLWYTVAFVVALSIIVAVHEYGHYIVGRWSGIHADVFSLGFGPVLASGVDRRGTKWQLAAIPLGGYVKFAGDANAASGKDDEAMEAVASDPVALRRTMHGAPLWARTATVAAGPIFNFILTIIVFSLLVLGNGQARDPLTVETLVGAGDARELMPGDVILAIEGNPVPPLDDGEFGVFTDALPDSATLTYTVMRGATELDVTDLHLRPSLVGAVSPKSAAIDAGLQTGDLIATVDGVDVRNFDHLREIVSAYDGAPLVLTVLRNSETIEVELTPRRRDLPAAGGGVETRWLIGITSTLSFEPETESIGVITALGYGVERLNALLSGSLTILSRMVIGEADTCNLSGPVGIAQVAGQMAGLGLQEFITLLAGLSAAVGLLNLLPIPMLDGGHLVFYGYEAVRGKPPSDGAMRVLMTMGLAVVLGLMLFGLWNDLTCV